MITGWRLSISRVNPTNKGGDIIFESAAITLNIIEDEARDWSAPKYGVL
ncbi:MAG: hypothetical protein HN618_05720 [Flavobacteriales bacterium]|nr:hypothetical protein [Flavobacteriales bacterium]